MLPRCSQVLRHRIGLCGTSVRYASGVPFETTVVDSMPKPIWLYRELAEDHPDFVKLAGSKGYAHGAKVWAYPEGSPELQAAWEDATRVMVHDQEIASLEQRCEPTHIDVAAHVSLDIVREELCAVSLKRGLLRDRLRRQLVVEVVRLHLRRRA